MDTPAKNIAFPIFLLVVLVFLLLLFLMVWLWQAPDPGEAVEQPSEAEAHIPVRPPAPDADEEIVRAPQPEAEAMPAAEQTIQEESAVSAGDTAIPIGAPEPKVYAEASSGAPHRGAPENGSTGRSSSGGGGGASAVPSTSSREAGQTTDGLPGSTYVPIPDTRQQPEQAPPEPDTQAPPEEEPLVEEEEPPEPSAEPPPAKKKRRANQEEEPPTSTAVVQAVPTPSELAVGSQLSVVVMISNSTNVGHVPFHLVYDPRILHFEYGEEGIFLGSDGAQTAFFAAPSSGGGTVVVGLSRLGQINGVSGGGELCVLHFTAVGPGTTALTFSREKVRDGSNRIVPAVFAGASVTVN